MGHLLLEGGAEFGGGMRDADLRAIELAGGVNAPLRILPTAAAPDNNHVRAGRNGVRWFQNLGARDVVSLPLIDERSAADAEIAEALRTAKLIYLLGGFPHYLGQTLQGSRAWQSVLEAYRNGAVVAGSSAGAMVLCQFYKAPEAETVAKGLGLVPKALMLPHHNTFGKDWAPRLLAALPAVTLIGIDERTGTLDDGPGGVWSVRGQGVVTLYRNGKTETYESGQSFSL